MEVKVKSLDERAILPTYATKGSGCFDIYTINGGHTTAGNPQIYDTGLAFEIPEDHVMLVFSRSGHGFNNDVRLSNCVGVIDSDYRGDLKIKLTCDSTHSWGVEVQGGDRIAQGMIIPVQQVNFIEVNELSSTVRGDGGFGSSGK